VFVLGEDKLKQFKMFDGLSDQHCKRIWELCERIEVAKGEVIIEQGTEGNDMFLIESGRFEAIHHEDGEDFIVGTVKEGQEAGVMAMVEKGKRSATLRATEPSVVYRLCFESLTSDFGDIKDDPYAVILKNQLVQSANFLRHLNDTTVNSLKKELQLTQKQLGFGRFVAFLIGGVTAYAFLLRILLDSIQGKVDSTWITVGVLVGCLVIFIPMMKLSGYPWSTYGLTLKNWKVDLMESMLWTFVFLLIITGIKYLGMLLIPSWKDADLFSFYGFTRYQHLSTAFTYMGVYCLFAPVQEFIARGAMQSSLHEFLRGKNASLWAVLLSTLMFSQIHLHLTAGYAVAAFLPSLFWGALYARNRSLLGVSLSHILIGVYVAFIMGFPLMQHS